MKSHVAALLAILCLAATVSADDRVFRLKNGRKIQGDLVEESPDAYVVRTSGGKTTLKRTSVLSVEDVPPPPKPFLSPDGPARPSAPAASEGESAPSRALFASAADIEAARKALASVPPVSADSETRSKALDAIRSKVALEALVGVVAESGGPSASAPSSEELLAADLVVSARDRAVPALTHALPRADLARGSPALLATTIERVGVRSDDLSNAVLDTIEAVLANRQDPALLVRALESVGTRGSLKRLFGLLLSKSTSAHSAALARTCRILLSNDPDPDEPLAVLGGAISVEKLPDRGCLARALELFEASNGRSIPTLRRILDAVGAERTPEAAESVAECLRAGFTALARIGTAEASARLLEALTNARGEDRRLLVVESIRCFRVRPAGAPPLDLVDGLVVRLRDPSRTEREARSVASTLETITKKRLGTDAEAWSFYASGLRGH